MYILYPLKLEPNSLKIKKIHTVRRNSFGAYFIVKVLLLTNSRYRKGKLKLELCIILNDGCQSVNVQMKE